MLHLELSKEDLMLKGISEREAEIKAMNLFGSAEMIGFDLQQSIFPFRKELMLTLTLMSFLYTISVYLLSLFHVGDAHIIWLVVCMTVNSFLLFICLNKAVRLNRRRWINSFLITHILTYLYGNAFVTTFDHELYMTIGVFNWIIILFATFLVYQTTTSEIYYNGTFAKERKRLHQINFILGIAVIGLSLFFVYGGLALFGGFHFFMLPLFIPLTLWILLYVGQLKLLNRHKRVSLILMMISILIFVFCVFYFLMPY